MLPKNHNMKILQVCGGPSWGGIEMQTVNISLELKNAGHRVVIFCSANSHIAQKSLESGIEFQTGLFNTKKSLRASYGRAKIILKSFNPDIIHVQRSHDLSVIVAALRITGNKTPLVFTRRMESRLKKKSLVHRWIYNRVDKAWGVSSFVRDNFLATSPMKSEKVGVMNNGIDLTVFDPAKFDKAEMRLKYSLPADALIIGMTGRISPMKGHADFIRSAAELSKDMKKNLHFVMAGGASVGEEAFATEIYKLASALLSKDSYTFIEQQSNLAGLLSALDLYVFPSHRESFGNVLLEAMAMQLPIIAVNAGGVNDMISCGKNAICVDPQQPKAIYKAMKILIENPEYASEIAFAAFARAQCFSRKSFLENLLKEYKTVIGNTL